MVNLFAMFADTGTGSSSSLVVQILAVLATLLASSGAISFFVRYNTRLTLVESFVEDQKKRNDTQDETHLDTRVTTMEKTMEEIGSSVAKLGVLDVIKSQLDTLNEELRMLRASSVPRTEQEARWRGFEQRLNDIASQLSK